MFYKTTVRPKDKPEEHDPSNPKSIVHPDQWVWDEFRSLQSALADAIVEPLEEYLQIYKKYEKECNLDVNGYIEEKDDEEEPPEVNDLKKDIYSHFKQAKELRK